ncbi:MAG: SIR2 family protein [Bacteroidia bacterium]|nr:SIR2 family protein [Bacteroidia bacterium]
MFYSSNSYHDLIEAIRNRQVILFAGGGLSMNLGLPSWDKLIEKLAEDLGFDRDYYRTLGDHLVLAEYYKLNKGIGSLRSWMDRKWHTDKVDISQSRIHQLLVALDFPIIYTTNYDRWIEYAFDLYQKPYVKISDVADIRHIKEGVTQIIKFHGDFDNDSSIVLTESSYFARLDFETPLDIKLRADVLGRSILFVGYSLKDINIRYLLYKLNKLWELTNSTDAKPRSFILLMKSNPVQERVLEHRGITTLVSPEEDPGRGLQVFLENLYEYTYGSLPEGLISVEKPTKHPKKGKKRKKKHLESRTSDGDIG